MNIILASASPRRSEILSNLNIDFKVMVADKEEKKIEGVSTKVNAMNLAFMKGITIDEEIKEQKDRLIISADTIVDIDGEILGKPQNYEQAKKMLEKLSGNCHQVITGYALLGERVRYVDYESTLVWFKDLSVEQVDDYIKTNEPYDKAGGYGIQGLGGLLVEKIEGDYSNVVGLPISKIADVLYKRYNIKLI